ncbi:MAG: MerR family DNA-binding transcriptional regulator, partial [Acidimicrobiaceae bacterium]|nr:MerR family DNA-binding transcriptional regulator [Acidimicrobiaceae bacterium]
MPELEEYLTIGQASERLGLATSALRFYEDKGLISSL